MQQTRTADGARRGRTGVAGLTGLAGGALARVSGAVGRWTPRAKPLHPSGVGLLGTVVRTGVPGTGVAWLEQAGTDPALARISRSAGLPPWLPDVWGLAVAVRIGDGVRHVLLSSAPTGRLGRYTLAPRWVADGGPYCCVVPFAAATGPLFLAAVPAPVTGASLRSPADIAAAVAAEPLRFSLRYARPSSSWTEFGELTLDRRWSPTELDPPVHFEPGSCAVPGLPLSPGFQRLRDPAYRRGREATAARDHHVIRLADPDLPAAG